MQEIKAKVPKSIVLIKRIFWANSYTEPFTQKYNINLLPLLEKSNRKQVLPRDHITFPFSNEYSARLQHIEQLRLRRSPQIQLSWTNLKILQHSLQILLHRYFLRVSDTSTRLCFYFEFSITHPAIPVKHNMSLPQHRHLSGYFPRTSHTLKRKRATSSFMIRLFSKK